MSNKGELSFKDKVVACLEILRIHNVLNASIASIAGYLVAGAAVKDLALDSPVILAAVVVALASAGGYVINDYFDVEVDRINKPERPIPSGRISTREAYNMAIALFSTSIILSAVTIVYNFYLGTLCIAFVVFNVTLLYYYSKKLKILGFTGNLVVSFTSFSSILFGGLIYAAVRGELSLVLPTLIPALYAFLIILSREIVKGIEDMEGDRVRNVQTLALKYGPYKAFQASLIPYFILLILSPLPYFYPLFSIRYGVAYLLLAILGVDTPATIAMLKLGKDPIGYASRARSLLKVSLVMGPLAFILGPYQF